MNDTHDHNKPRKIHYLYSIIKSPHFTPSLATSSSEQLYTDLPEPLFSGIKECVKGSQEPKDSL